MSSFLNEHSIELVLASQFGKIISVECPNPIPIFFWSTREGSNLGKEGFQNENVKIIALYARRPKVIYNLQDSIEIKFNQLLFERCKFFEEKGIPVFAGTPLVSSLKNFHMNCPCVWFSLLSEGYEEIINIDLNSSQIFGNINSSVFDNEKIIEKIRRMANPIQWKDAVTFLRAIRTGRGLQDQFFGWRFSGDFYKPIYFILPID